MSAEYSLHDLAKAKEALELAEKEWEEDNGNNRQAHIKKISAARADFAMIEGQLKRDGIIAEEDAAF